MLERRENQRVQTSLFVRFDGADDQNRALQHGSFTQDVSLGGMRLLSPVPLKANVPIFLNIDIPNDPEMAQVEAQVRWAETNARTDENGNQVFPAGVEFAFIERQDAACLRDFLNYEMRERL
ncbi:MAG: PilZ domain-containing protein [Candidatus Omnitrophica bacterium]|nr:PilZ domain-containing protein [Candidatus Omnitrophota bacterium]